MKFFEADKVRIGILFLVLQAMLLCATVQAGPIATDSWESEVAGMFGSSGTDEGVSADEDDAGDDLHCAATAGVCSGTEVFPSFPLPELYPLSPPGTGNTIRAPPSLA